jgi:hypothetical protein
MYTHAVSLCRIDMLHCARYLCSVCAFLMTVHRSKPSNFLRAESEPLVGPGEPLQNCYVLA